MLQQQQPIALTIAGSDSGAGAGIQADLKVFARLGVHGTSAITCVTAQNPKTVAAVYPMTPEAVRGQVDAIFAELRPQAGKTGMLFSKRIIRAVAQAWRNSGVPLVVDPVMIATSGKLLLQRDALRVLTDELLPIATLVTPNLAEAEVLLGIKIKDVEQLRAAARIGYERFGCATLVKGGHFRQTRDAVDFFYDGTTELLLVAPFVKNVKTHGTGCAYSAAITAYLARELRLPAAVENGKQYITQAIADSRRIGKHSVLGF